MATVDVDYDRIDEVRETKHAYFVIWHEGIDEVSCFVPKSQVEIDEKHKIITMPEWLAKDKELI